jgi:hypothetical protein
MAYLQSVAQRLAAAYPQTNKDGARGDADGTHVVPDADRVMRPIAAGPMAVVGSCRWSCARTSRACRWRARRDGIGRWPCDWRSGRPAAGSSGSSRPRGRRLSGAAAGVLPADYRAAGVVDRPLPIPITLAIDFAAFSRRGWHPMLAGTRGLDAALNATRPQLTGELKRDVPRPGSAAGACRFRYARRHADRVILVPLVGGGLWRVASWRPRTRASDSAGAAGRGVTQIT